MGAARAPVFGLVAIDTALVGSAMQPMERDYAIAPDTFRPTDDDDAEMRVPSDATSSVAAAGGGSGSGSEAAADAEAALTVSRGVVGCVICQVARAEQSRGSGGGCGRGLH